MEVGRVIHGQEEWWKMEGVRDTNFWKNSWANKKCITHHLNGQWSCFFFRSNIDAGGKVLGSGDCNSWSGGVAEDGCLGAGIFN